MGDLSFRVDRDREHVREKGAGSGRQGVVPFHCAYAYGSLRILCRDELGVLWLLKQHDFSNCLYLFTCGRSSLAGQRNLRVPPMRTRKIRIFYSHGPQNYTGPPVKRQRFNSAWKGRETSR